MILPELPISYGPPTTSGSIPTTEKCSREVQQPTHPNRPSSGPRNAAAPRVRLRSAGPHGFRRFRTAASECISLSHVSKEIDLSFGDAGPPYEVAVKIQGGDDWELNIWSTFADLTQLRGIREAVWNERRSITAGTSAGAQVFWCANGDTATVMIGHDDETWDIALQIPIAVVEKIATMAEARQLD